MNELKEYLNLFKKGTKTMFKEFFKKDTNKKQRANMWSFSRIIIPIITLITSIIAIISSIIPLFVISGIIAGFAAVTDRLDGLSSRKHNSQSEYGALLDQFTDKYFAGIVGTNLLFLNPNYLFLLLGELLIGITNITYKLKYKENNTDSTFIGKVKQLPLYTTLALGFLSTIKPVLLTISNVSIIITSLFQLATTGSYIVKNEKEIKERRNIKERENKVENEEMIEEKNDELVKTNDQKKTKLELYKEYRDLLNKIIEDKKNNESIEDNKQLKKTIK